MVKEGGLVGNGGIVEECGRLKELTFGQAGVARELQRYMVEGRMGG